MKTPLRTLTCALAAASAIAAVPAGANPGPQRATGGPGASALLKNGVLTMHWRGGSARIDVPPDYLLPAVTTRGELGGLSFDGKTAILAYSRQGEGGRSRFLVAENGKLTPLAFRGHRHVRRHRSARDRPSSSRAARRPPTPTKYTVLAVQPRREDAQPGRHQGRVLGRGRRRSRTGGRCRASR